MTVTPKIYFNGLVDWLAYCSANICPNCPLLSLNDGQDITDSSSDDANDRWKLMMEAKDLIANRRGGNALEVLLDLAKLVSYKLNEDELALMIRTSEVVVRYRCVSLRRRTMKDMAEELGFVKANIYRVSMASGMLTQALSVNEKENFRDLLLTLADTIQMIRYGMSVECIPSVFSDSQQDSNKASGRIIDQGTDERKKLYLAFFSLFIQSAFLEAGLVAGKVYVDGLVRNAENIYYLTKDSHDKKVQSLKPLGAYIYGRLLCETDDDESDGVLFLSKFYKKNCSQFEALLDSCPQDQSHSVYFCNMRRIRQLVLDYKHL